MCIRKEEPLEPKYGLALCTGASVRSSRFMDWYMSSTESSLHAADRTWDRVDGMAGMSLHCSSTGAFANVRSELFAAHNDEIESSDAL